MRRHLGQFGIGANKAVSSAMNTKATNRRSTIARKGTAPKVWAGVRAGIRLKKKFLIIIALMEISGGSVNFYTDEENTFPSNNSDNVNRYLTRR